LEFSAETSDDAHEALTDFHVATAPTEHVYVGDGREYFADAPDAEIDAAVDGAVAPMARRVYTQVEIDGMTDAELDAATDAAIAVDAE
jgi:hypothetical protein